MALFIPSLFVSLWSTGFIVGRMIIDSASPNIFLAFRFFFSFLLFFAIAKALKKQWPPFHEWHSHAIAGFFINGIYLGGSYWAIAQGFPAALMALLGALQPIITMVIRVANTTVQKTRMKQLCFMHPWQDNPLAKNCGCSCSP